MSAAARHRTKYTLRALTDRISTILLGVSLIACVVASAGAQNNHRQGFWAEIGSGFSVVRMSCEDCESTTSAGGSSGYLRLGGTLSPKVLLGVELFTFADRRFGFLQDDRVISAKCGGITALVLWYPWRSHLFLRGGAGIANGSFTVQPTSDQAVSANGAGIAVTFGAGMDIPVSRALAITLNAATFFTAIGDIELPNRKLDDVIPTSYMLSLGLTLR